MIDQILYIVNIIIINSTWNFNFGIESALLDDCIEKSKSRSEKAGPLVDPIFSQ